MLNPITVTDPATLRSAVQEWAISKRLLNPDGSPAPGVTLEGQMAKVKEEIAELISAAQEGDPVAIANEIADVVIAETLAGIIAVKTSRASSAFRAFMAKRNSTR